MQRTARAILLLWMITTWVVTGWVWAWNPFARPVIEQTTAEVRVAFQRAMTLRVTPDWLLPRLTEAVTNDRPDDITLYRDLAAEHGIRIPLDLAARSDAVIASHEGWIATTVACHRSCHATPSSRPPRHPARRARLAHYTVEFLPGAVPAAVLAFAVGALHDHQISAPHTHGITQDRCAAVAEVTTEHQDALTPVVLHPQLDDGGAEDMAGIP